MTRQCEPRLSPRLQKAVDELKEMIRERYPTAQFLVSRAPDDARAIDLLTTVDIEDPDEVMDLVIDRVLDLQEKRVPIHVIPLRPVERVIAEARKASQGAALP